MMCASWARDAVGDGHSIEALPSPSIVAQEPCHCQAGEASFFETPWWRSKVARLLSLRSYHIRVGSQVSAASCGAIAMLIVHDATSGGVLYLQVHFWRRSWCPTAPTTTTPHVAPHAPHDCRSLCQPPRVRRISRGQNVVRMRTRRGQISGSFLPYPWGSRWGSEELNRLHPAWSESRGVRHRPSS